MKLTEKSLSYIAELHRIAMECPHDVADIFIQWSGHCSYMQVSATAGRWSADDNHQKAFEKAAWLVDGATADAWLQSTLVELRTWLAAERSWSPEPLPDTSRPAAPAEVLLNATLTPLPDERRFQAASRLLSACFTGHRRGEALLFAVQESVQAADALLAELDKTKGQP